MAPIPPPISRYVKRVETLSPLSLRYSSYPISMGPFLNIEALDYSIADFRLPIADLDGFYWTALQQLNWQSAIDNWQFNSGRCTAPACGKAFCGRCRGRGRRATCRRQCSRGWPRSLGIQSLPLTTER